MDLATMPAGEEIDRLVAEKVMGWLVHPRDTANYVLPVWGEHFVKSYRFMASTCCSDRWAPSTKIADAWRVVEHMRTVRPPERPALWWNYTAGAFVTVPGFDQHLGRIMHDDPAAFPLAICRASLQVVTGWGL